MGAGSKFDSNLATRGGRKLFVLSNDIANGNGVAQEILNEMEQEYIKFAKDKIVFAAKLENGNKIFLESGGVEHIISRHKSHFEKTFGCKTQSDIVNVLCETIEKGKLVSSKYRIVNGINYYSNKYYYRGVYSVVYGISDNGYIETAYPENYGGN